MAADRSLLRRFKWELFARSGVTPQRALTARLQGHRAIIRALAFYGKYLLSASDDTTVRLWDTSIANPAMLDTQAMRSQGDGGPPPLPLGSHPCVHTFQAHDGRVHDMLVAGDDLFTCSSDATVRRWHLPRLLHGPQLPQPVAILEGHRDCVTTLAHHGRRLFSGGMFAPFFHCLSFILT